MWTRNDSPIQKLLFWEFQWYSKFCWVFVGLFLCISLFGFWPRRCMWFNFYSFFFRFSHFFLFLLLHVKLTPRVCLLLLNCFMVIENVYLCECVRKLNSLIVNRRRRRRCCNYSHSVEFWSFFLSRHQHSFFHSLTHSPTLCMLPFRHQRGFVIFFPFVWYTDTQSHEKMRSKWMRNT